MAKFTPKWECISVEFGEGDNAGLVAFWMKMKRPSLSKADANLIEAAPDMYEALKSLLDSFNSYARIVSSMRRETTTSPAVQMAVAALAKADGHE